MEPEGRSWSQAQQRRIAAQLDQIATRSGFVGAPRLMKLLRYLVQAELNGEGGEINQNRIAMEVMGRGAEFDPSVDSLVRVEAGRLRSKLREYYATDGKEDIVRFDLPKGRYNPNIVFCGAEAPAPTRGTAPAQEIRFLKTADATTLAYSVSGKGPPLVKAANWLSHLEFDLISPVWRHWWTGLSRRHQLIRYDERGCGLSDWNVDEFSTDAWVNDLESVVEAVGVKRFALLGISQGAAVAISFAVRHPGRVSRLILYGGFALGRLKRKQSPEQAAEAILLKDLVRVGWGQDNPAFRKTFASLFMPEATAEQIEAFDALQRASTSPANAERFLDAFNNIDVLPLAARVRVPTLVLHARHELEIPMAQGRLLASTIPGARLVPLESRNHILSGDEPAWQHFLDEVERFVCAPEGG